MIKEKQLLVALNECEHLHRSSRNEKEEEIFLPEPTSRAPRGNFGWFHRLFGAIEGSAGRLVFHVRIQGSKQKHLQMSESAQSVTHAFLREEEKEGVRRGC